ncbi:TIGR03013 family PEP-CTERM/XrtA system glycosyltransferase [Methylococcus sp. EFPC2]|nr:TIGR03013 family PEP-CTERM/XrtA system glycosyltransferase [Methylococcus sp. EFPC2]
MIRIFRHYISSAFLILFFLEIVVFAAAFPLGSLLRAKAGANPVFFPWDDLQVPSLVFTTVMLLSSTGMGLYQRSHDIGDAALLLRIIATFMMGTAIMSLVFYAFPAYFVGRGVFGYALLSAFTGVLLGRFLFLRFVDGQNIKRRVLVLGAGYRANMIRDFEQRGHFVRFRVIGYVRLGDEPLRVDADKLMELAEPLCETVTRLDIDEIVVAPDDRRAGQPLDQILDCKMAGVDIVDLLSFFEREAGLLRVDCLYPSWLVFSDGFRVNGARNFVKRAFDVVASLSLLLVVWPIMVLTALAISLESGWRGPILYRQIRVGLNWKTFKVIKFRSMRTDAEKGGAQWARANDDRVTWVGRFIRKTRIDELPQLFNVLKGEMSFVGPRPERPEFVERFAETIPYYSERHRVKPGITGWAQLCYPYGSNYQDAIEKLQYDLYYVKNYSPFLDLLIMLQTVEVVLWGKGAR